MDIIWKGKARPEFDDRVRQEIADLQANGLAHTDNLITHLIEIGDIEDGPLIEVHGWAGKVYATYIEKPEWVTHRTN